MIVMTTILVLVLITMQTILNNSNATNDGSNSRRNRTNIENT